MPTVTVNIDSESVDRIVVNELETMRGFLLKDLKHRQEGGTNGIFHTDPTADIETIQKNIDALELVMNYFIVPENSV